VLLKINGEPIDFTLEKEAVVSEVVKGVEDWLGGSGFLITGIRLEERDLLASPRSEWAAIPIASVSELDFRVSRPGDVRIEHWIAVNDWLGLLAKELEGDGASLAKVMTSLPETLTSIEQNPFLPPGSDTIERLGTLFAGQTAEAVRTWPSERTREASFLIAGMRKELARRVQEATHPKETLKAHLEDLKGIQARIGEVSVLLQTGKDRQAMETVIGFSELVQKLLGLVRFLPRDSQREKLFEELNTVLRQLISAFDAKDLVLIGDLFEYEVAPRIGRLLPLLEKCL
jgi:hypothetical protein